MTHKEAVYIRNNKMPHELTSAELAAVIKHMDICKKCKPKKDDGTTLSPEDQAALDKALADPEALGDFKPIRTERRQR